MNEQNETKQYQTNKLKSQINTKWTNRTDENSSTELDEQNEKTVLPSGRTECDNSTNKWNKYNTKIVPNGRTEGENSSKNR
jgi:hypothetical protein